MAELDSYINQVIAGKNLLEEEAALVFKTIMDGNASFLEIEKLLIGLKNKGESVDELVGAARVLRAKSGKIDAPVNAIDTCGTGGDASGSLNISTAVAFVLAGCGVPVAKHGNRSVSSKSGSADVLIELGVNINAESLLMEKALAEAGICFMMAPKYHKAMSHVAEVRKKLGVRTIFNLLGPLISPAQTNYQLLGVYDKNWVEPMAKVLLKLGVKSAWVVHGDDGLDEITTTTKTHIAQLKDSNITTFTITPEQFAIKKSMPEQLKGADAVYNAKEMKALLNGQGIEAYRDIVLLNSAAGLLVAGEVDKIEDGISVAARSLDEGKALVALNKLIKITNDVTSTA